MLRDRWCFLIAQSKDVEATGGSRLPPVASISVRVNPIDMTEHNRWPPYSSYMRVRLPDSLFHQPLRNRIGRQFLTRQ